MTSRDAKYLAWLRELPCVACGRTSTDSYCSQAAHVRVGGDGGMGLKPSDYRAVPLCFMCHRAQHDYGERTFWERAKLDPQVVIATLLVRYIDDKRAVIAALSALAHSERAGAASG